jgi:hypothetical protein
MHVYVHVCMYELSMMRLRMYAQILSMVYEIMGMCVFSGKM